MAEQHPTWRTTCPPTRGHQITRYQKGTLLCHDPIAAVACSCGWQGVLYLHVHGCGGHAPKGAAHPDPLHASLLALMYTEDRNTPIITGTITRN